MSRATSARRSVLIAMMAFPLVASAAGIDEKEIAAPRVVKFKELIAAIKEHKGKVVVADFWADT